MVKKFWRSDIGFVEQREWIRMTIKRVWVKDRKVVGIEPHDNFKPLFVSHRKVLVQPASGTIDKKIALKAVFWYH